MTVSKSLVDVEVPVTVFSDEVVTDSELLDEEVAEVEVSKSLELELVAESEEEGTIAELLEEDVNEDEAVVEVT